MAADPRLQAGAPESEQAARPLDVPHQARTRPRVPAECPSAFGVWLTTREVMHFVPCASVHAARQWVRSHGLIRRANGTVARRDVEAVLARPSRRGRHPHTLANLTHRRAS